MFQRLLPVIGQFVGHKVGQSGQIHLFVLGIVEQGFQLPRQCRHAPRIELHPTCIGPARDHIHHLEMAFLRCDLGRLFQRIGAQFTQHRGFIAGFGNVTQRGNFRQQNRIAAARPGQLQKNV